MPNIDRIIVFPNNKHLCSIRYHDETYADDEEGELRRLLRCWQDPGYLTTFFEAHKRHLRNGFYSGTDFLTFLERTDENAVAFQRRIQRAIDLDTPQALKKLFRPLDNRQTVQDTERYQPMKARTNEPYGWLRLYALRTHEDVYIITGGAIKLTHRMDVPHLERELKKIAAVRKERSKYLRDDDFYTLYPLLSSTNFK